MTPKEFLKMSTVEQNALLAERFMGAIWRGQWLFDRSGHGIAYMDGEEFCDMLAMPTYTCTLDSAAEIWESVERSREFRISIQSGEYGDKRVKLTSARGMSSWRTEWVTLSKIPKQICLAALVAAGVVKVGLEDWR